MKSSESIDVVVIGGGPAGMMAAATAASTGASVVLLEKNNELGKKLSITGGGRCNVTNNKPEVREMLDQYKEAGKFLFSTFTQYGVKESIEWFSERGVPFIEENEGRLFPSTESALTIRDTLVDELKKQAVEIRTNCEVQSIAQDTDSKEFTVTTKQGLIKARKCIVSTGGYSRPETGSTGDGLTWLKELGHSVKENDFALVPLALKNTWTKKLSGLSLSDVKLSMYAYEKKQSVHEGRILFTHQGVTGPMVLNMSKEVGDFLEHTNVTLMLNTLPKYDAGELKERIKELLASNKMLQNALSEELPLQLVKGVLKEIGIDGETPCHSVSTEDRKRLRVYLQAIPLEVKHLLGADKAVVSSGGVELNEIDFKTMESKKIPGLYLVGDMLNINRPSGGYSLQLCWSTGSVAGVHSAK